LYDLDEENPEGDFLVDNVDFAFKLNKETLKPSGYFETLAKRLYCVLNPKNSSLFFACTVSQSLLAYDKKKDFKLFFESQTRRESWCLETLNDEYMFAVGQSEGRICFYEASRRKAKFRERHSLQAFGTSSVWCITRLD